MTAARRNQRVFFRARPSCDHGRRHPDRRGLGRTLCDHRVAQSRPPRRLPHTTLFTHEKGENYVLEKLGEETTETILAAKDDDGEELLYESADLVYHLLVLLSMKDASLDDLRDELKARF